MRRSHSLLWLASIAVVQGTCELGEIGSFEDWDLTSTKDLIAQAYHFELNIIGQSVARLTIARSLTVHRRIGGHDCTHAEVTNQALSSLTTYPR
jgi:hypothetical protein